MSVHPQRADPAVGAGTDAAALLSPHPVAERLREQRSAGERLADALAARIGSWRFLVVQTGILSVWVVLNVAAWAARWDPYPFVLMNLLFSVQAAYTGPILLLSQNRAAARDRMMAEHDYVTNDKSEKLVEAVLSEVLRNSQATLAIAQHLGIELDALAAHEAALTRKMDDVQAQLTEVEDVLTEERAAASDTSGATPPAG